MISVPKITVRHNSSFCIILYTGETTVKQHGMGYQICGIIYAVAFGTGAKKIEKRWCNV